MNWHAELDFQTGKMVTKSQMKVSSRFFVECKIIQSGLIDLIVDYDANVQKTVEKFVKYDNETGYVALLKEAINRNMKLVQKIQAEAKDRNDLLKMLFVVVETYSKYCSFFHQLLKKWPHEIKKLPTDNPYAVCVWILENIDHKAIFPMFNVRKIDERKHK